MDQIMVKDTCEALLIDDANDKVYVFGVTESSTVTTSMSKEELTGGLGNTLQAIMQSDKKVGFEIQNLFFGDTIVELTQGGVMASGTKTIPVKETKVAVKNLTDIEVEITGTPVGGTVQVVDTKNKMYEAVFEDGTVTITDGVAGEAYHVVYTEEKTVEYLDLNANVFPSAKHVVLRTIGYDPKTNVVLYDYYWDFPNAVPDGNTDYAFTKATNANPSISFDCIADANGSYGTYIREVREQLD